MGSMLLRRIFAPAIALIILPLACPKAFGASAVDRDKDRFYLPGPEQSRLVSVSPKGEAEAEITVMTQAVAIKETGPKETVQKFGEVYTFAPSLVAVRQDQPTRLTFWNLQPDDKHDFMLADPHYDVLMHIRLEPLSKTSYVFTFHKAGVYPFYCAVHQPEMNGQILVLPAK
jgi:plastocyanin